jgi:hypothetical protein
MTAIITSRNWNLLQGTLLNEHAGSLLISYKDTSAGELQSNSSSLNPCDFTGIFAEELSIHTHVATITNVKASQRGVGMYESTAKRDILDRCRIILISQLQYTFLFGIDPFV